MRLFFAIASFIILLIAISFYFRKEYEAGNYFLLFSIVLNAKADIVYLEQKVEKLTSGNEVKK